MTSPRPLAGISVAVALVAACSGVPPIGSNPGDAGVPAPDWTGCGQTGADVTTNDSHAVISSPNASYDHATCRNAFVVSNTGIRDSSWSPSVEVWSQGTPIGDETTCVRTWARASLWKKEASTFVKVDEQQQRGKWVPSPPGLTRVCLLRLRFEIPSRQEHKIAASVGTDGAGYRRVTLMFGDTWNQYCPEVDKTPCVVPAGLCDPPVAGLLRCGNVNYPNGHCAPPSSLCAPCDGSGFQAFASLTATESCGACAGKACTRDADCAPGLSCNAVSHSCSPTPGCVSKPRFCYAPWPLTSETRPASTQQICQ